MEDSINFMASPPLQAPLPLDDLVSQEQGWITRLREVETPYSAEKVDSSKVTVTVVRAVWDFEARDDTELSFKKGDSIIITIQADGGWWQGQLGEKEGKIPINRVMVTQILEKKRHLKINQDKVTNRIKALQRLVSRENVRVEAPAAPQKTSSPLAEKSPIGTRRRRAISTKLVNSQGLNPMNQEDANSDMEKEELELERRREQRRLERERRQKIIEREEEEQRKRKATEDDDCSSSAESEESEISSTSEESEETESSSSDVSSSSDSESSESELDGNRDVDEDTGKDIDAKELSSSADDDDKENDDESTADGDESSEEDESSGTTRSSEYESSDESTED